MIQTVRTRKNSRARNYSLFYKNTYRIVKRLFDLVISSILLIVSFPLFIYLCHRMSKKEGHPIFSKELCYGKHGKKFMLWSFRTKTMPSKVIRSLPPHPYPDSWEKGVPDMFRITEGRTITYTITGNWLRKYHLDKLPHLWNVWKGDMSIIGPSPESIEIAQHYNEQQSKRLTVKPGMIGYAQLQGLTNEHHGQKIKFDLYYVKNYSLKLDAKILIKFVRKMGKGAA